MMLPILEDFRTANSDAARAGWLLTAPLSVLWNQRVELRELLDASGFIEGRDYLSAEIAMMAARRLPDGSHAQTVMLTTQAMRSAMRFKMREREI